MVFLTKRQWESIRPERKGRITHDFNPGRLPGRGIGLSTILLGFDGPDGEFILAKEFVEGLDFVIDGHSTADEVPSLI